MRRQVGDSPPDYHSARPTPCLRRLHWDLRLQPFHGYGSATQARVLAKVLYASPRTSADFHDQPVHDMRTVAVRGWRNFTSQVAPHQAIHLSVTTGVQGDTPGVKTYIGFVYAVNISPDTISNLHSAGRP